MKGLELSRRYYETYGKSIFLQFPQLEEEYAAGLVGRGSECFGFDDEISKDHDYGPSFCIWLRRDIYERYGKILQEAYDAMPREFMGFPGRKTMETGQNRVGVLCIEDFYYGLLGIDHAPETNLEWLALASSNLATATNGEVFEDRQGTFSEIRKGLLAYYPEDVRLKKIVACMARASRAGQYNYARAMKRGERVAAELFLHEFIKEIMSLVYLLNRKYAPFDKWIHRGMEQLSVCFEIGDMINLFYRVKDVETAWQKDGMDDRVLIIEAICNIIVQELNAQGLSNLEDNFLQSHLPVITAKIQDEKLRNMQFLEG
ncbi:MAG: DUF4037 domain-containing protein [Lachnospiraceae bacterium]|nr:DUF4037 domain-containing protein [Lachnospiraceae bacterium]